MIVRSGGIEGVLDDWYSSKQGERICEEYDGIH